MGVVDWLGWFAEGGCGLLGWVWGDAGLVRKGVARVKKETTDGRIGGKGHAIGGG